MLGLLTDQSKLGGIGQRRDRNAVMESGETAVPQKATGGGGDETKRRSQEFG